MKVGIILPHLKPFGGVRRFLEVAQHLTTRGHDTTIYTASVDNVDWASLWAKLQFSSLGKEKNISDEEIVLIGDPPSFKYLAHAKRAKGIYVWVIAGGEYTAMYQALHDKQDPKTHFLLNNRAFQKDYAKARLCEGGTNTDFFTPKPKRRVGYYVGSGRVHVKGEPHIEAELGKLSCVELVPLRGMSSEELRDAYRSLDWFVSWETRTGWSNTAAEALACGVPVVTSGKNCEPFSDLVIKVDDLAKFFTDPMRAMSWSKVVDRLEAIWREDGLV